MNLDYVPIAAAMDVAIVVGYPTELAPAGLTWPITLAKINLGAGPKDHFAGGSWPAVQPQVDAALAMLADKAVTGLRVMYPVLS